MCNMYIFAYVGYYAGGAALVACDGPEEAKRLLSEYLQKASGDTNIEEVFLRDYDRGLDGNGGYSFYLTKIMKLKENQEKGVVFVSFHEG